MKNLTVKNIIECTGGVSYNCGEILDVEVTNVTIDTRKLEKGGMFVAIVGSRVDGHDYFDEAMRNGALAVIGEKDMPDISIPYIKTKDTHLALQDVARLYRESLDVKVVGISGSVGKTSTKEMIAGILSEKFIVQKTSGNFNNEIGVPLTLFDLKPETQVAVVEMGINHFGEMRRLSRMAKPDICVLTNIGDCHLEYLTDRQGVYKAKSEMFENKKNADSPIILNGDDPILAGVSENGESPVMHFSKETAIRTVSDETGIHECKMDAYASDIKDMGLNGSSFILHMGDETADITLSVPGLHMISNMLSGALVGKMLGMSIEEIRSGAQKARALKGRGLITRGNGMTVFDDCYNANPVSMKSSLDVLERVNTRKVAILGDMGELGEDAPALHYQVGEYAAHKDIEVCIFVGPLSAGMKKGYDTAGKGVNDLGTDKRAYYFETKEEFLSESSKLLKEGDSVLVKASHYMDFEKIVDGLTSEGRDR